MRLQRAVQRAARNAPNGIDSQKRRPFPPATAQNTAKGPLPAFRSKNIRILSGTSRTCATAYTTRAADMEVANTMKWTYPPA